MRLIVCLPYRKRFKQIEASKGEAVLKIKLIAAAIVAAVLISAGVIAGIRANISETDAAPRATSANSVANPQPHAAESAAARNGRIPYIGIAIARVPEDAAAGATDAAENPAGALIVKVMAGSPADGNLQKDDIITALDGDAIDRPRDVVAIVRAAEPGDAIVFSVRRGDAAMDISVTVDERAARDFARYGRGHFGGYSDEYDYDDDGLDGLILSETRRQTDEGVMTERKAVGTVQSFDAARGVLNLLLADESETLTFTINDDTEVLINRSGSLGGLSSTETTLVVEVIDAEGARNVEMVAQGEMRFSAHDKDFDGRGFGFPRSFRFGERAFDFPHFDWGDDAERMWHKFGWDDDPSGGDRNGGARYRQGSGDGA